MDDTTGAQRYRATGVFAQVQELKSGGYWLLAREDYRDFGQAGAERVFPVLPDGERHATSDDDPPYYVSRRKSA
jgi:hypothetical protein